jgi:hypothetical protein
MVLTIFLSIVAALMAAFLAFVGTMLISYAFALGDLGGVLSFYVAPLVVGIWMFIFTFRKLSTYISN